MARAKEVEVNRPEHYIFPFRLHRGRWDPTRPTTGWMATKFFGQPPRRRRASLAHTHCFRHMAITAMLENDAAPETVRHIAVHVSETMMRHYSHNRLASQVGILAALDSAPTPKTKKTSEAKRKSPAARAQQRQFMIRGLRRLPFRHSRG
jgi:hypothetical protein